MGGTTRITIVADVHERASGLPDALTRLGALVEGASLPAGDYAVGAQTIGERKSVLDLHGSILKGRFCPRWSWGSPCCGPRIGTTPRGGSTVSR